MQAWQLVHAWRLLPALNSMPLAEEGEAFLRWAQHTSAHALSTDCWTMRG
jgi:hypothetical protein